MNASNGLKNASTSLSGPDPLDRTHAAIEDGREATKLPPHSLPAPVKAVTAVMDRMPPTHRWVVAVMAAATAGMAGHRLGWW